MSVKDNWISEYDGMLKSRNIHNSHDEIINFFDSMLRESKIKFILTSRIKGIESLKEKIKRNELDQLPEYRGLGIIEVLDDMIGIRIICMKNDDENNILNYLSDNEIRLGEFNLELLEPLELQPKYQNNGHPIYRIKATYNSFGVEIQIKSLANLFWGEMEHLLIYKNNKYLMNNTYYKKEMGSIYKELDIIDSRLSYMEEVMMSENEDSLIHEKKDILKRLLYLNVKDKLKVVHEDEYLNNNFIYEAIADLIFEKLPRKKKNREKDPSEIYNKRLSESMNLLLDSSKMSFELSNFNVTTITESKTDFDDVDKKFYQVVQDLKNGWWYFIIIHSLLDFNGKDMPFVGEELTAEKISVEIDRSIEKILKILKTNLYGDINRYWRLDEEKESKFIKEVVFNIKCEQIDYFASRKKLSFTNDEFRTQYKANANTLVEFISLGREYLIFTEEQKINISNIAKNMVRILSSTNSDSVNIKRNIQSINEELNIIDALSLSFSDEFMSRDKITVNDLIHFINRNKDGGK